MTKFVVYINEPDNEVLIMTKKNEEEVIDEYFNPLTGRDIDRAIRREVDDTVVIVEAGVTFKAY